MNEDQISNNDLYVKLLAAIKQQGEDTKNDILDYIKCENAKLVESIEVQDRKLECLDKKYSDLEFKYLNLERQVRKNNVVIFGLEVNTERNLCYTVVTKLNELLGINIREDDLNNVYAIKTSNGSPIKVEFLSYLKKDQIFKNIHKLKNSHIFIANDLCYNDRMKLKILQKHQKLAKSKNLPTKIIGLKLLANGEFFTADQLENPTSQGESEKYVNEEIEERSKSNSAPSTPHPYCSDSLEYSEEISNTQVELENRPSLSPGDNQPVKRIKLNQQKLSSGIASKSSNKSPVIRTRLQSSTKLKK